MELIIKEAGIRLDKALADLTELSRSQANDEIKKGTVLVNGKAVKAKYAVKVGDVVTYEVLKEEVLEYTAENIPLDIIYEDDDVAVVNKPQGMVVHPSVGHTSGTLVNALMYHIKDLSSINGVIRPGIVHRIDKDTSGLLMIAKNDTAHNALAAELKDKKNGGYLVYICSASIEGYLRFCDLPVDGILGTKTEVIGGKYTSRMIGNNCKNEEKVTRLTAVIAKLGVEIDYENSYAYSDSMHDIPMLKMVKNRIRINKKNGEMTPFIIEE